MKNMKERVLEILEKKYSDDGYVSGEYIAGLLDITRAAVWKSIKELQSDGYKIYSMPHKGYSLAKFNDVLSKDEIKK
ncbi:MAG: biotin operon repressor, partial [Synergistaceae bacterium]|nr:biotin operon repressor [Synergistaceae bacterium]